MKQSTVITHIDFAVDHYNSITLQGLTARLRSEFSSWLESRGFGYTVAYSIQRRSGQLYLRATVQVPDSNSVFVTNFALTWQPESAARYLTRYSIVCE